MKQQHRIAIVLLLVATLLGSVSLSMARGREANVAFRPGNLIRLHIIANSDTDTDQAAKLEVRDAVLKAMETGLAGKTSADEAYAYLNDNRWIVRDAIDSVISVKTPGMPYRMEFGEFDFPDRAYGDRLVPAGRYRALRIVLGEGKGKNWWCVLFPPLCFKDLTQSTEQVQTTPGPKLASRPQAEPVPPIVVDEDEMKKIKVEYRLKILEWARRQRDEDKHISAEGAVGELPRN